MEVNVFLDEPYRSNAGQSYQRLAQQMTESAVPVCVITPDADVETHFLADKPTLKRVVRDAAWARDALPVLDASPSEEEVRIFMQQIAQREHTALQRRVLGFRQAANTSTYMANIVLLHSKGFVDGDNLRISRFSAWLGAPGRMSTVSVFRDPETNESHIAIVPKSMSEWFWAEFALQHEITAAEHAAAIQSGIIDAVRIVQLMNPVYADATMRNLGKRFPSKVSITDIAPVEGESSGSMLKRIFDLHAQNMLRLAPVDAINAGLVSPVVAWVFGILVAVVAAVSFLLGFRRGGVGVR